MHVNVVITMLSLSASVISTFGKSSNNEADSKISHSYVLDKPLPFYVALIRQTFDLEIVRHKWKRMFWGGSMLFHPKFTITACHNGVVLDIFQNESLESGFYQFPLDNIRRFHGIAGTNNIESYEETYQRRKAARFYKHPNCRLWVGNVVSDSWVKYDLGVYEFRKPFTLTLRVGLIPHLHYSSPQEYYNLEETIANYSTYYNCTAYGFGYTEKHHWSAVLKWGNVQMKSRAWCTLHTCTKYWEDREIGHKYRDDCLINAHLYEVSGVRCGYFFESSPEALINAAAGDSGGPVACLIESKFFVAGVLMRGASVDSETNIFYFTPMSIVYNYMKRFLAIHTSASVSLGPPFALATAWTWAYVLTT